MDEDITEVCRICHYEIDPEVCWCGRNLVTGYHENHYGIPNGCRCFYEQVD